MKESIKDVLNEIQQIENFDLKLYFDYIEKYGKELMLKVFSLMLMENVNGADYILDKYFDVYFTIELEKMEINEDTYLDLVNKYGDDKINNYFIRLLEVNNNSKKIKQKYEKIYFYIETIKSLESNEKIEYESIVCEDGFKCYLREICNYPLLSFDEEKRLLNELASTKGKINIATFDDLDNIKFKNVLNLINSVRTKEQFMKIKVIIPKLVNNDQVEFNKYKSIWKNEFKQKDVIKGGSKVYSNKYLDEQLNLLVSYIEIREKLINSNLRLVVSVAKRYIVSGIEISDLVSEGNIGLIKAIKRFDINRNTKISTYATWWIRQAITRYISDNGQTIRIPVHFKERIDKYRRAFSKLSLEYGDELTTEMIADYLGMTVEEVLEIEKVIYTHNCLSLDEPITNKGYDGKADDSFIGTIADENTTEDIYNVKNIKETLKECLRVLNDKEKMVLLFRFGLYDGNIYTLEQIGKMLGVTRERIRQIENKAIRKLGRNGKIRALKP